MDTIKSKVLGSLIGGAIGDALGYPIEFLSEESIKKQYGFVRDFVETPLISDDTQMTLYTAVNFPFALTRGAMRGVGGDPREMVYMAKSYLKWYEGQVGIEDDDESLCPSFLRYVPYINVRRAPGNTCLSALRRYREIGEYATIEKPFNNSKGCGGVMRVAPVGLYFAYLNTKWHQIDVYDATKTGAEAAALTHGHPLGYIPAAYLSCLIFQITSPNVSGNLFEFARESLVITKKLYGENKYWDDFESIVEKSMELATDDSVKEIDAIHQLGEGWVGEEALAISLFCCLRHQNSFADAVSFAVNHNGDSDSTGAITGNIIGAYLGFEKLKESFPNYWKVEAYDLMAESACDLCREIPNNAYKDDDEWWSVKYECWRAKEEIPHHWERFRKMMPGE